MKKTTSARKTIHNVEKIVKGVLYFCEHMTERKPDNPTESLGQKFSLREMVNGALNNLVRQSIDNHLITEEKGMTLTFLGDYIIGKNALGNELKFPDVHGNEEFNNASL